MGKKIDAGQIQYGVKFNLDKTGLNELKTELQKISHLKPSEIMQKNPSLNIDQARGLMQSLRNDIKTVNTAFDKAFNSKLGITNIKKLNEEFQKIDLSNLRKNFSALGQEGQKALSQIAARSMTTTLQFKETNNILQKMGETFANTVRWKISSGIVNTFTGSISQAYGYVKHLDSSLNDIRIVTGKSADEMERFARTANKAAKALGSSTTEYTEAALIYYQQGLSDEEANARAATTLKAANVTGQSGSAVSEELTAVWNGYKVSAEETELAVDKLAAVAATTAADLEELSVGMSKVASAANNMGVDMDQLNAQIATIVSVTRQAPESVGTALKTIYARMSDLKVGGTDEDDLKLGDVSGTLEKVGISILDTNGDLREMGDVIEEVAGKWDTWTKAQQAAIAQSLAGKRQYNNLVSLFDNWDMYEKALDTSRNSMGTLQEQQDIYMESTEAHIQVLQTQWEDFYDSILDTNTINNIFTFFTDIVKVLTKLADSIGGFKGLLLGLGSVLTRTFSGQISTSIADMIIKFTNARDNAAMLNAELEMTREWGASKGLFSEAIDEIVELKKHTQQYYDVMSQDEIEHINNLIEEAAELEIIKQEQESIAKGYQESLQARAEGQTQYHEGQGKVGNKASEDREAVFNMNVEDTSTIDLEANDRVLEAGNQRAKDLLDTFYSLREKYEEQVQEGAKWVEVIGQQTKETDEYTKAVQKMTKANALSQEQQERLNNVLQETQKSREKVFLKQEKVNDLKEEKQMFLSRLGVENEDDVRSSLKTTQDLLPAYEGTAAASEMKQRIIDLKNILEELERINQEIKQEEQSLGSLKGSLTKNLNYQENTVKEIIDEVIEENEQLKAQGQKTVETIDDIRRKSEETKNTINATRDLDIRKRVAAVTKGISGLTSTMFALNGATTAANALINGDFSTGLMSLATTVIPSLIRGVNAILDASGPLGVVLNSIAVGTQVVGLAFSLINADQQRQAKVRIEELKEEAEKRKENIEIAEDQVEAIDKLATAYQNVYDKKDAQGKLDEEQKSQIKDLIEQYDDEHLRLLLIAEDYEAIEKAIRGKQKAERDEIDEEYDKGIETELDVILETKATDAGGFEKVSDFLGLSTNDAEELINKFGKEVGQKISGKNDFLDFLLNPEHLTESLKALKKLEADDTFSEVKDNFKSIEEYIIKKAKNYNENKIYSEINFDDIKTTNDMSAAIEKASNLIGKDGEKIGRELAEKIIFGYSDELHELGTQTKIKEEIFNIIDPTEENEKYFENLDDEQRIFLYSNKELAADSKNLEKFFKKYETEYDRFKNEKNKRAVEDLFEHIKTTKKGEADFKLNTKEGKEIVSNLYNAGGFEDFSGISEEDFFKLDFSQQQQALSEYYHTLYSQEEEFRATQQEGIRKSVELDKEALAKRETEYNKNILKIKEKLKTEFEDVNIDALLNNETALKNFEEKYGKIRDEVLQEKIGVTSISSSRSYSKTVIRGNALITPFDSDEERALAEYKLALKELGYDFQTTGDGAAYFSNELKSLDTILENTEDAIYSFTPELESYKGVMHDINSEIDSLQSSYQTLQDVAEDYNDDQKLSLDNLQKVLEMDKLYLATLEFENGQLKINESSYETMIQAEIKEAQMTATQTFMKELLAIKNGEAAKAGLTFTERQYQEAEALREVAGAAQLGINKLMELAAVQDAAKVDTTATETAVKAYYAEMQLISNVASQDVSTLLGKADKGKSSHEKYLEREYDIYKKINEELNHIEKTLTKIDTIESHSWGVSYLDALQEQNKLLDEQLEKLEEKKALQVDDLSTRKKQLEDLGINFAEGGAVMTNSEDVLDALYESYNKNYVDKFNAMSKTEQENFKLEKEQEEDRIKKIEKAVEEYEKLYGEYEDIQKQIQDLYYKQIEKDVEEFNFEINLKLELSDARKEWNDFWYDVVKDVDSDDFVGQIAKSFSKLGELIGVGGSSNNDVLGLTQHLKETLDEVNTQITTHGLDGLFGTDTKLSEETLTNYRDKLMSALKDAKTEIENISDNYLSMLESAQDMIDKQVEGWENIGDQINHNIELIKLISGENSYDALAKQYEQQYENNLQTIEAQRIGRDYWKERVAEYKELLANAEEGTEEYKTLKKALEESTQKYIEANKNLNASVEESIKNLQEWRKNSISAIMDTLDKSMSGGLGTDMLEQEWKLINDYADQYFDNVERAVNMEEYTNILQDAANATGLTAENQAKINEFMDEELKKLNEKEKLTQYDIDESKARLEILKAEMALQDAQQNKSNMRLRRDSQGNYTYQYTGNEQAIEDAEKAGLTARKAWYELVKKRNKETNDYIIQLEKDRVSLMKQLDEAELAGDTEKAAKIKELLNRNEQQILFAYEEAQKTKQDLFSGTAQYFENVENAEILPMWEATVTQLVDDFAGDKKDSFITACKNAIIDLEGIQQAYADQTKEILTTAGIEYQKLVEEGIDPAKDSLEDLNGSNEELAQGLEETNKLLDEMNDKLVEASTAYENFKDDAVSAIQAANQALEELARTHMDVVNQINSTPIDSSAYAPGFPGSGGSSSSGGGEGSGGGGYTPTPTTPISKKPYLALNYPDKDQAYPEYAVLNPDKTTVIEQGILYPNSNSQFELLKSKEMTFANYEKDASIGVPVKINGKLWMIRRLKGTSVPKQYAMMGDGGKYVGGNWQFKSGGYTGNWSGQGVDGIGGRMAVLHQKELVLNESDTSNMLAAVKALRQIDVDKLAQSILATSIATAQMQLQTQLLSAQLTGLRDQYESVRNTTINADFSGVRTADEILRAFEELENYGLQQYNTGDASYRSY